MSVSDKQHADRLLNDTAAKSNSSKLNGRRPELEMEQSDSIRPDLTEDDLLESIKNSVSMYKKTKHNLTKAAHETMLVKRK